MNAALLALVAAMNVVYEAPPTVSRFLDSNAFVRVIQGPVGSSKSSGCVSEVMRRALEQEPGSDGIRRTRFAVVRNTYRELEDTTRKTFEQWLGSFGHMEESSFTFLMDLPLGDGTRLQSEVLFRALDRPQDVKKLLSLELTGAYMNEIREVPKVILDGLTMRVGRYPSKAQGGCTWYGVWADTNPWAETSEYAELFKVPPEGFELYVQPSGLSPDAENIENLPDGYYARMCAGKDAEWIAEYVEGKNPKADKGSVYGDLLVALEQRGGIGAFEHPNDGVHVSFDLGISDATAMWFWRLNRDGFPDLIDWYEATGQPASHYFDAIDKSGYGVQRIWLPHDARARTFQTGVSTYDLFSKEYPNKVSITPELSLEDGLGAARWLLEQPMRIHARCAEGVKRLRAYRYEWDEDRKVFSKKPVHDWTSHTADDFRYVAVVAKAVEAMRPKPPPAPKPVEGKPHHLAYSMNDLWKANRR